MADDDKNKQLAEYSGAAKVFAAPTNSSYPRFDRENFGVWKALMKCGLRANELLPLRYTRTSKKDRLVRLKTRQAAPAALDLVAHICVEALDEAHQEAVHLKAQVAHQPAWEAHVVHMSWLVLLYV